MAVIVFSGWVNQSSVTRNSRKLARYLEAKGINRYGDAIINQYDDPWTPANRRTNEIQFELPQSADDIDRQTRLAM